MDVHNCVCVGGCTLMQQSGRVFIYFWLQMSPFPHLLTSVIWGKNLLANRHWPFSKSIKQMRLWHFHLVFRLNSISPLCVKEHKHELRRVAPCLAVRAQIPAKTESGGNKQKHHFTWSNGDKSGECKREMSKVHLHTVVMPVPSKGLQPQRQFLNWSKPLVIEPSADSPQEEEGQLNARGVGASAGILQARKITMKNFDVTPRSRSQLQDQQREQHQHRPGESSLLNSASSLPRITFF